MHITDLIAKISTDLAVDSSIEITESTELLMSGLIDSLGIINLVTWIEEQTSTEIDPGDVVIENFETSRAIMTFVDSLKPAGI